MSTETTTDFSEYTVTITNEPSYYGTTCTQEQADRICNDLRRLVSDQFPGVVVNWDGHDGIRGPSVNVIDEIHDWIGNNWTAAL